MFQVINGDVYLHGGALKKGSERPDVTEKQIIPVFCLEAGKHEYIEVIDLPDNIGFEWIYPADSLTIQKADSLYFYKQARSLYVVYEETFRKKGWDGPINISQTVQEVSEQVQQSGEFQMLMLDIDEEDDETLLIFHTILVGEGNLMRIREMIEKRIQKMFFKAERKIAMEVIEKEENTG
ncbi:hypothetical protein ACFPU1_06320 [Thalassorhabdus alkalitolerans]|uniref:Uncharacterized protein n=1 Tax=Thalassorhabdus alkalitolerans TaxID=2282697 RepID=A0ABW0YJ66_9BACI